MKGYTHVSVSEYSETDQIESVIDLINEEPLSIRVQGNPYTVVMRTPGDEIAHVAGFCLGEGIADSPEDLDTLAYCDDDINVVTATINKDRASSISDILMRRGFISQTSCGICGKELVDDLKQRVSPVDSQRRLNRTTAIESIDRLGSHQKLRAKTRASHAAALFSENGDLLSIGEDAGRHNALDKSIGKLFLENKLNEVGFLVLSSRISYELVQKAARAKIPVIIAVSRPTALAVSLGEELGMTLACLNKSNGLYVFCNPHRLE